MAVVQCWQWSVCKGNRRQACHFDENTYQRREEEEEEEERLHCRSIATTATHIILAILDSRWMIGLKMENGKEMVSINQSSCDSSKSFHSNRAQALLLVS